jgi:hypothetical protein
VDSPGDPVKRRVCRTGELCSPFSFIGGFAMAGVFVSLALLGGFWILLRK